MNLSQNVLIAGDLNADCNYVNKGEWFDIRLWNDSRFHWLIDNSADTTVTDTDCAYDRLGLTLTLRLCRSRDKGMSGRVGVMVKAIVRLSR